ncbi:uncharacterized protein Z520_00414 [Fonsecaea multimorphosa CBS 102226]|uniref:Uncharacterized protein n=1 Tax=Fonsecaea multimorphosa CBS 102226 TaxID=1442371 RepID=A0A0D2KC47_9EURO|nr:uncharacterized protein Z520_00414 [Fonsecaea multimorphosa CBS 102226]KIY03723.1 hypothetical protein Z520_00414 [Fonsecaea multimorphosa CBS 102226]
MATSIFSYGISRPYPFGWFTPATIAGGSLALVLFSFLNLLSTGYYQSVEYVTDPNSTITASKWLDRFPSYFTGQMKASCQAEDIQVNTRFFTNQTALTYTITGVWTTPDGTSALVSPALTYLNNPIQNCQVNNIQIELESEDRSVTQYGWNAWGEYLQAFITCSIQGNDGTIFFNLSTDYDFVPDTAQFPTGNYSTQVGLFSFVTRNATTKASLWWGESLLSQYWSFVSSEMQTIRGETDNNLRKGTIHFSPPNASRPLRDITDLGFFNINYRFISNTVVENESETWGGSGVDVYAPSDGQTVSSLASTDTSPNVWIASDSLAKAFYSTIMTDLGQVTAVPNILTDATALQYFSRNITAMQKSTLNAIPGPADDSYDALKDQTGPLGTSASVISTKYLCQVPKRKSAGTLVLSILVADLVFLQALWKVFTLCTDAWLTHKNPRGAEDSNTSSLLCPGSMVLEPVS